MGEGTACITRSMQYYTKIFKKHTKYLPQSRAQLVLQYNVSKRTKCTNTHCRVELIEHKVLEKQKVRFVYL